VIAEKPDLPSWNLLRFTQEHQVSRFEKLRVKK